MLKVVITDDGYACYDIERRLVESVGGRLDLGRCDSEDAIIALTRDADGVIVRLERITARVISSMRNCRVIARYGIGVDNIDIDAATRKGIVVARVVNYGAHEVAEHAIALLFSCARKIASHDRQIRAGSWDICQRDPVFRISGSSLGIIGYGRIGTMVARKVAGLGLRVIAFDPYISCDDVKDCAVTLVDFDTLLRESDYVTLHAPLTSETRHMIDSAALDKMKETAILINTARGGLVDTRALCHALKQRRLRAAGIDVHEEEPVPVDYCLFGLDNVVITDHAAWYSEESIVDLQRGAAEAVVAVLTGGWPEEVVNPEVQAHFPLRR